MKRTLPLMLAVCICIFAFAGCSSGSSREYNIAILSDKLLSEEVFSDILSPVPTDIAANVYGFDKEDVKNAVVYCSTGATTEEIGMFKCVDEEAAGRVLEKAKARIESQKTAYVSYAPGEVPKLEDSFVKSDGIYVFYIVSVDNAKVTEIMK